MVFFFVLVFGEYGKFNIVVPCLLMQLEMIRRDTAYAFFSHTHKAQEENMPLLDKALPLPHIHQQSIMQNLDIMLLALSGIDPG